MPPVIVLHVAEKNDAAKGIAAVLSGGQYNRREGLSVYNKIYTFAHFWRNQQAEMVITSVSGHLLAADFSGDYAQWNNVPPSSLFDAPIREYVPNQFQNIKNTLQREVRRATVLVIWTDCDREGEKIGYEVHDVCKEVNRGVDVYRAVFSEITGAAINRAYGNLGRLDARVRDAVDCRIELDLRTGAAFTRLQTLRLRQSLPQLSTVHEEGKGVVSYGSCQFPTLGFVVERYKRIQQFVPETFWKIVVRHTKDGIKTEFLWKRVRLFARPPCEALLEECQEDGIAKVINVRTKPKSRWRPTALDTVELEKLGSRKLRMTAKDTMATAEKLYTKGFISYPRTETNAFPPNLNLQTLAQNQVADHRWGAFAQGVLNHGPNPRNGNKSDQAHPPIHPLKPARPGELQGYEATVYELVVRHFLACISSDAKGLETLVDITVGGEEFCGTGLVITHRGYLEVYTYDTWNAKSIAAYAMGETFKPDQIEMVQGSTSSPKLLTEADLIALMDKHGIGTDATHSQHIETVKTRTYVGVQDDGRFIPGFLGLGLVDGYDHMGYRMSKPNLRAEFEADLKQICSGTKTKAEVLQHYKDKYRAIFQISEQNFYSVVQSLERYFPPGRGRGQALGPPGFKRQAPRAPYQPQNAGAPAARGAGRGRARGRGQTGRGGTAGRGRRRAGRRGN